MAKFYNSLKSMKSCAIGTIMPWTGDLTKIPIGWVKCNGSSLNDFDYPLLFEVIGYTYGGASNGNTFTLPALLSKSIVDFHPSHQNILGIDMPDNFKDRIGTDTANLASGGTSKIDLKVMLTPSNNFSGTFVGNTLNPISYQDTVTTVPRLLGDHHMGSHSHPSPNETGIPSVAYGSQWVEACQGNFFTNCAFDCPDDCETVDMYIAEGNGNASLNQSSYVITNVKSANTLGALLVGLTPNPFATGQLAPQNTPYKNYLDPSDDTIEVSPNGVGGVRIAYPAGLNHNEVNFVGIHGGHAHNATDYSINQGSVKTPNNISYNTITSGNLTPVNSSNQGIAQMRVDNIDTPSLSITYIIRAY